MRLPIIATLALALAASACQQAPRQQEPGAQLIRVCAGGADQLWADAHGHFLVSANAAAGTEQVSQVSPDVLIDEVCPAPYL